jgi:hypothetical protein
MGGIQSTFAPIPNDSKALKIALDILGLSYALFAAPMWNIGESLLYDLYRLVITNVR